VHIVLFQIVEVTDDAELKFAKAALFARHPAMKEWPAGHGTYFF